MLQEHPVARAIPETVPAVEAAVIRSVPAAAWAGVCLWKQVVSQWPIKQRCCQVYTSWARIERA